jgi:hypothetical protein
MRRALLEVVACRAVSTPHEVMRFIKCTLLAATTSYEVRRTLQQPPTEKLPRALRSLVFQGTGSSELAQQQSPGNAERRCLACTNKVPGYCNRCPHWGRTFGGAS